MTSIKIALWNSGGLTSTADSTQFFDKEFPNSNFDIAAFVETHHRDENDFPSYIFFFFSGRAGDTGLNSGCKTVTTKSPPPQHAKSTGDMDLPST